MSQKISSENIKELRIRTGAGMMDCKKALEEAQGQVELAIENLRKKGLIFANKKASRIATEGIIETYIHVGAKLGVMVELNCETDFVARQSNFHNLAKDIAMQLAACQLVKYVSIDQIPQEFISQETSIEMLKDDLLNKPESIKKQIVNGRIQKKLKEISLMNQSFIKNPEISVEDLVKQNIALLGENIKVRRFERFILGEGLEKKSYDFTQEVSNMIYNK